MVKIYRNEKEWYASREHFLKEHSWLEQKKKQERALKRVIENSRYIKSRQSNPLKSLGVPSIKELMRM